MYIISGLEAKALLYPPAQPVVLLYKKKSEQKFARLFISLHHLLQEDLRCDKRLERRRYHQRHLTFY